MKRLRSRLFDVAAIGCVTALFGTSLAVHGALAAPVVSGAAAPVAPTAGLSASAASAIAPGAHALVDASIRNLGETNLAAPVVLTVNGLPAGVTVLRIDDDIVGKSFVCTGSSCTLVGPDGTTPVPLESFEVVNARVRLAVAPGTTLAATLAVGLAVTAAASTPPADLTGASATVTLARLAAGVPGSLEAVATTNGFVAGQPTSTTLRITNLGPSTIGGAGANLVVNGLLPPGATNWTFTGTAWNCLAVTGLPRCTWTGTAKGVGSELTPLVVSFRAPPTASAAGTRLTWTQSVTHTPATGTAITVTTQRAEPVLPDRAPTAAVFALASGPAAVERGSTVDVAMGMAGTGLDDPSRNVQITATLPTGWTFVSKTSVDSWSCSAAAAVLTCARSADFAGPAESSTTVRLRAGDTAAIGPRPLTFTGSVTGAGAGAATTDTLDIQVGAGGAPLSSVRLYSYPAATTAVQIVDSSPLVVTHGTSTSVGVDVLNFGNAAIPAGTSMRFTLDLPLGTTLTVLADAGGTAWSCASVAQATLLRATCTRTSTAAIAAGAATPRAKLGIVLAATASAGPALWPLAVSATLASQPLASLAATAQVPVEIRSRVVTAAVLALAVDVVRTPRLGGRTGLLSVTPSNAGTAAMAGWTFTLALPAPLAAAQRSGLSAACTYRAADDEDGDSQGNSPGVATLTCASNATLAIGAAFSPLTLPIAAPATAGADLQLVFTGGVRRVAAAVIITTGLRVLPALRAAATATPNQVILPPDPSLPVPLVQLDGRASVAVEAQATWTQQRAAGEPSVTFTGFAAGQPASGLVATFRAPAVTVETTLHFRLTVSDGSTLSSTPVVVVVEPAPIEPQPSVAPTVAASANDATAGTRLLAVASSSSADPVSALAVSTGAGSWTWTTNPTISKSDDPPGTSPVRGSLARVVGYGTYVWDGPGPEPLTVSASTEWQTCETVSPFACTIAGTGDAFAPSSANVTLNAIVTITGLNPDATTTETFALGEVVLTQSSGSGSWSWTTDPTIKKNDLIPTAPSPIYGSRMRVLDYGAYVWNGPGPEPTGVTVTTGWRRCVIGAPACTLSATGDVHLPSGTGFTIDAVVTIAGTDGSGNPVSTTAIFPQGEIVISVAIPRSIVAPSISGTPDVGNLLTGDDGEFTLEVAFDARQRNWLTCTGPTVAECTTIPNQFDRTYVVQPSDAGRAIRFRVIPANIDGIPGFPVTSSAVQSGVTVNCGTSCYSWSVDPAVDRNGAGAPAPVTGRAATLVDDGTYAWNDPTAAPGSVASSVAWFTCLAANPSACTQAGTGRSYTPTTVGLLLEARLTISGSFAVDGSVRTGTRVVPFGTVRDANLPPIADTLPSISGSTFTGEVLTANPGVWSFALNATRTYSWLRCAAADPNQCTSLGVTTPTYTVQLTDLTENASVIRVDVTAPGYVNPGTARSAPTTAVNGFSKRLIAAPVLDAGVGGPRAGVAATATPAVWSAMPATTAGPTLEWQVCTTSAPSSCAGAIATASGTDYVLEDFLVGRYVRVLSRISGAAIPTGSIEVTSGSNVIGPVLAPNIAVTATTDLPGGTASIANGETLQVVGSGTGAPTLSYSWSQTSGPAVITNPVNAPTLRITAPATGTGTLGFRFTVTDGTGATATADISVEYGNVGAPPELCDAVALAQAVTGAFKTLTYGGIAIEFAGGSVNAPTCTANSVVTLNPASVVAYGFMLIQPVSVTIDATGATITGDASVELTTGTALDDNALRLLPGASLQVPFNATDGSYELVGALVSNQLPGVIGLPSPWTGAARLALGDGGGVQTITFSALAWDGSLGAATPVPGQLPTPPVGSPTVSLTGSVSTNETFTLSLSTTGLIKLAGTALDFSGSVSRPTPGQGLVFTASAALAAPVALARNIVLQSASLTWDGESFGGGGALTLTVNGRALDITAAFSFTDPRNWSANVSVAGGGTWSPVRGLDLTSPTLSGSIRRTAGATAFSFAIGAAAVNIAGGVRLVDASLGLNGVCADGTCGFDLAFSTGVTVTMFGGSLSATLAGTMNTATGAFSATAALGAFRVVDGLSFGSATFRVDRGVDGLDIKLTADVFVLSQTLTLTITYGPAGALVLVEVGTWTPFTGAPTFADTWLLYSSYATTVTVGGQGVVVAANSLQISAHTGVPTWFARMIGDSTATADVSGTLSLTPLTFDLLIGFSFNNVQVFSVGGFTLRMSTVIFTVSASGTALTTTLSSVGSLRVPAIGGGAPSDLSVEVSLFSQSTTGAVGGSVTLRGVGGAPAFSNAFGVPNLTIQQLAVSVAVSPNGAVQLGLAGTVILPPTWGSQIGIIAGTPISLAASIAGASSCIGIEIGEQGATTNAIDVAGLKALTATHASLYIAPTGCDVGAVHIDPGLALSFDGAILGVAVRAQLVVAPAPLSISASLQIGDINLKGLSVRNTTVTIEISPTVRRLTFAANTNVFGVVANVSGEFSNTLGISTVDFHGTFTSPNLGGFQLDDLTVDFHYVSTPSTLTVTAQLAVTLLGQPQAVEVSFTMLNGVIVKAAGSAQISLTIGQLAIAGTGTFAFSSNTFPTITIAGTASVGGRPLTSVSGTLRAGYLEFAADLNLGGIFTSVPHLAGQVAWKSTSTAALPLIKNASGTLVQAGAGDFRFEATNIGLGFSGVTFNADVMIGNVAGVFFADIATKINFGVAGYASIAVEFRGQFDSTGNFALAGNGSLTVGGVQGVSLTFAMSRQAGTISMTAGATITIPNLGAVAVSGSFTRHSTLGWLYELNGTLTLQGGGHTFADTQFKAYRRSVGAGAATGMESATTIDVPDLVRGNVTFAISSNGNFAFETYLATTGKLGDAVGNLVARVKFTHTATVNDFAFSLSMNNVMKIPASFTVAGSISSNGSFAVSATVSLGPWSGTSDWGVCTAYYSAGAYVTVTVTSVRGPGALFSIGATASLDASAGCGSIGVSIGLRLTFTYTAPASFALSIKLHLGIGDLGSWEPTLYSA